MNRQREITDILNKWAHEYYVLDAPTVSDKEYDKLYDELRALEQASGVVYPDSPTRRVGGDPLKIEGYPPAAVGIGKLKSLYVPSVFVVEKA